MLILWLVRLLRGYVRFGFSGGFTQSFINSCVLNGINLRGVAHSADGYTAILPIRDYKKIRRCVRSSGVSAHIISKHGLPFALHSHRRRFGIPAGAVIILLALWLLPQHVWEIRITGNSAISDAEISDALESIGVYCGMPLSETDYDNARQRLILRLPSISWCSLNIDGCVMTVEVRERVAAPEKEPEGACNLIASCDGRIVDMRVLSGEAVVKPGDAVLKGDLLVSGVVEYATGETGFKQAKAVVTAQTVQTIEVSVPYEFTSTVRTGEKTTRRVVRIFGVSIPLYLGSVQGEYEYERDEEYLTINGHTLPVGFVTGHFFFTETCNGVLSREKALKSARQMSKEKEKVQLSAAEIVSSCENVVYTDEKVIITTEYVCRQDIVLRSDILISEE